MAILDLLEKCADKSEKNALIDNINTLNKEGYKPSDLKSKGIDTPEKVKGIVEAIARRSIRVLDETADSSIISRVKALRGLLTSKYKTGGNFGYAKVEINGLDKTEFYAHSGIQELTDTLSERVPDISLKPAESEFKFLEVNSQNVVGGEGAWARNVDTEFKIVDDISKKLNDKQASGTIKLFTELPPCRSCDGVILQFLQKYPNIKIEIIHNNGVKLLP